MERKRNLRKIFTNLEQINAHEKSLSVTKQISATEFARFIVSRKKDANDIYSNRDNTTRSTYYYGMHITFIPNDPIVAHGIKGDNYLQYDIFEQFFYL